MYTREEAIAEMDTVLADGGYVFAERTHDDRIILLQRYDASMQQRGFNEAEISVDDFNMLMQERGCYENYKGWMCLEPQ